MPNKANPRPWTEESNRALLKLWRQKMNRLLQFQKNRLIILEIVAELETQNFNYTYEEVRVKMSNMKSRARKEMKRVEVTGVPSEWEYYEPMENIMILYKNGGANGIPVDEGDESNEDIKEWKPNAYGNPDMDLLKPLSNDNDIDTESEDIADSFKNLSQSSNDVSTNISFVSVTGTQKRPTNPLHIEEPATKRVKISRASVMAIEDKDDMDLFFLSIVKTIKKLPYHEQVRLKQNISHLVFQAELKNIPKSSS